MLLRQTFKLRNKVAEIRHPIRALFSTDSSLQKTKYSIQGQDNVLRSKIFQKIPENLSVYDFVTSEFSRNEEKIAIIDGISGKKYSFGNLDVLSRKFGSFLVKKGFKTHDTLAVFAPNCINYCPVLLGTIGIGGSVTTANHQYTRRELASQLIDSKSKIIVTSSELLETAKAAAHETGIEHIVTLEDDEKKETNDVISWSDIISDSGDDFKNNSNEIDMRENCAFLPYSSGTTGKPKGVVLTHHNIVSNLIQLGKFLENIPRNVNLGLLPFYHIYGLVIILMSGLQIGTTTVTLPNFEPHTFLQAISDYKIDFLSLVPPLLLFLVKSPDVAKYDISSIKYVSTGAAPFGIDLWKNFQEKYLESNIKIIQGYGLTEVSPLATLTPADDIKIGSVGKLVSNSELKVVDVATGNNLGPNAIGEVAIKGPHVMKGYLNNPTATNECITEDRWFFSGDIGFFDEEHNLFIVDRFKELIKYKGLQVSPAELEDLLISHPKVSDAAVIGIPDERAGEIPKAFVVAKDVTEEEIIKYIESLVAPSKRLRGGVEFMDAIPKAPSGKILRRILREKLKAN